MRVSYSFNLPYIRCFVRINRRNTVYETNVDFYCNTTYCRMCFIFLSHTNNETVHIAYNAIERRNSSKTFSLFTQFENTIRIQFFFFFFHKKRVLWTRWTLSEIFFFNYKGFGSRRVYNKINTKTITTVLMTNHQHTQNPSYCVYLSTFERVINDRTHKCENDIHYLYLHRLVCVYFLSLVHIKHVQLIDIVYKTTRAHDTNTHFDRLPFCPRRNRRLLL